MRNFRWLVVWVFAVLILGCGDDPIVNPDITPDENMPLPGRIAFASDRDGDFEIYMINADGTSLVRLTESKGVDYPSSWSLDGRKLAFVSDRNGSYNRIRHVSGWFRTDGAIDPRFERHRVTELVARWSETHVRYRTP